MTIQEYCEGGEQMESEDQKRMESEYLKEKYSEDTDLGKRFPFTEKFTIEQLYESLEHLVNDALVFHRDSRMLQEYDVKCENYIWDFFVQAIELDDVREKLMEAADCDEDAAGTDA